MGNVLGVVDGGHSDDLDQLHQVDSTSFFNSNAESMLVTGLEREKGGKAGRLFFSMGFI